MTCRRDYRALEFKDDIVLTGTEMLYLANCKSRRAPDYRHVVLSVVAGCLHHVDPADMPMGGTWRRRSIYMCDERAR